MGLRFAAGSLHSKLALGVQKPSVVATSPAVRSFWRKAINALGSKSDKVRSLTSRARHPSTRVAPTALRPDYPSASKGINVAVKTVNYQERKSRTPQGFWLPAMICSSDFFRNHGASYVSTTVVFMKPRSSYWLKGIPSAMISATLTGTASHHGRG